MNFADIAPGALAWNEAASIDQTLSRPEWLPWVLIFDSESKNGAQSLARCFASVTVDDRRIDTPTSRWEVAIHQTAGETNRVLALDADCVVTRELSGEIGRLDLAVWRRGDRGRIRCCAGGKPRGF